MAIVSILLFAASGCVSDREWTIVEICGLMGVKVHQEGHYHYPVGGDQHFKHYWARKGKPAWIIEEDQEDYYSKVISGSLSSHGLLALARMDVGIEILRYSTSERVAKISTRPLAVAWSRRGDTLAFLEQKESGPKPARLVLWRQERDGIASWELDFQPGIDEFALYSWDRFAISWNADDTLLAVSTRSVPWTNMRARCDVIDPRTGPLLSYPGSDAHFLGRAKLLLTDRGQQKHVWLMSLTGKRLIKERRLHVGLAAAASDPSSGLFVTWQRANWGEPIVQTSSDCVSQTPGRIADPARYGFVV